MINEPATEDLVVRIGRSYRQKFQVIDSTTGAGADLTGWGVSSDIREKQESGSSLIASFSVDITELSTGIFYLELPEATIDAIKENTASYDAVLTDPVGFDDTYFLGIVSFRGGATKRPA